MADLNENDKINPLKCNKNKSGLSYLLKFEFNTNTRLVSHKLQTDREENQNIKINSKAQLGFSFIDY